VKLTWQRRQLHLRHPFNVAGSQISKSTDKQVLLISIEHGGQVGWGEAAPSSYYKQSLDSAERVFAQTQGMLGDDPLAIDNILDALEEKFRDQSAAIAAIDGALHDLAGKLLGKPVWQWLKVDPANAPLTSMTIGIDDFDVIAEKVCQAEPYPILKVKVGTRLDEKIMEVVRREAPAKVLRVDANCGFTSADVLQRCRSLAKYDIELIEQPTRPGDCDVLAAVRAEGIAPLIADESCVGAGDVDGCAGIFDGINIKLSKCGGIRRAGRMITKARKLGLKVMLGCMVETSVGIAAAAQLAGRADYLDLDGHLLLADDPFEGIGGHAGKLTLSDRPGIGVNER